MAHVVGGHQLVDQLQPAFVQHRLDEQPNLLFVELAHAHHQRDDPAARPRSQGRIPEGFPRVLISGRLAGRAVYGHVVPFTSVGALLERERELGTLREGLDRARAGEGTLLLIEGPAGRRQDRAGARGARGGRAGGDDAARGEGFGARAAVCVRRRAPAVGARDQESAGDADLFAGAAGPAARLFEPRRAAVARCRCRLRGSPQPVLVGGESRRPGPAAGVGRRLPVGRSRFAAVLGATWRSGSRGFPSRCFWPDVHRIPRSTRRRRSGRRSRPRPSAVAMYPRPLSESAAVALARERLGAEADEEFCRSCHTATGGNPLFLGSCCGALEAAGVVPSAAAAGEVQAVGPAAVSRFVLASARRARPVGDRAGQSGRGARG